MTVTPGKTMLATGLLHQTVGLLAGLGVLAPGDGPPRRLFAEIARDGVVGVVERDPQRTILFWFLFFGLLVLALGWLMDLLDTPERPLPSSLGWVLLAIGLAGGLLIPVSGFWLVVPQGLWVVWRARAPRRALSSPSV